MKRGFVSVILAMVLLLSLSRGVKVYNSTYDGIQDIRNQISLRQRINERTYELENGFRLTVAEALETLPKLPQSKKGELVAREYICLKIREWGANYPDRLYFGYIDPNDYSEAPAILTSIDSCFNFLYVNLEEKKVELKDNGLLGFPYSLVGYRIAAMFSGEVDGAKFKVIIPEGAEMGEGPAFP